MAFETFDMARSIKGAAMLDELRSRQRSRQQQGVMQQLRRAAMQGSQPAKKEIGARDPDALNKLQTAINKMDKGKRDRLEHGFDMQGRLANYVQSTPPPLRPQAYREGLDRIRQNDPELFQRLPKEYSPRVLDQMQTMSVTGKEALTNAQRDIRAQGVPPSSEKYSQELKRSGQSGGGKFTKSDRVMELARKIANDDASEEEQREYDLLIRADPLDRLMRKFGLDEGGQTGGAAESPEGALPEDEALEVLRNNPTDENKEYFKETYGYVPSL